MRVKAGATIVTRMIYVAVVGSPIPRIRLAIMVRIRAINRFPPEIVSINPANARRMVVLPEPVGPFTRIMPKGDDNSFSNGCKTDGVIPKSRSFIRSMDLSSTLSTAISPCAPSTVATRKSTFLLPTVALN
jgi:hypothetical protein